MNIPVTINGITVEIPVDDTMIEEAIEAKKRKEKKTGYERNPNGVYYFSATRGDTEKDRDFGIDVDGARHEVGNYYTHQGVADNNVRADNLMRQLRRFAAEHGGCLCPKLRRNVTEAYVIRYDGNLRACDVINFWPTTWGVLFVSKESCEEAIKAFHDELLWYFAQYDPMPEGWWED